jgi:hypothetical protein
MDNWLKNTDWVKPNYQEIDQILQGMTSGVSNRQLNTLAISHTQNPQKVTAKIIVLLS